MQFFIKLAGRDESSKRWTSRGPGYEGCAWLLCFGGCIPCRGVQPGSPDWSWRLGLSQDYISTKKLPVYRRVVLRIQSQTPLASKGGQGQRVWRLKTLSPAGA